MSSWIIRARPERKVSSACFTISCSPQPPPTVPTMPPSCVDRHHRSRGHGRRPALLHHDGKRAGLRVGHQILKQLRLVGREGEALRLPLRAPAASLLNEFREDGDGDLLWRLRADGKADWRVDPVDPCAVKSLFLQHLKQLDRAPPRADEPQIARLFAREQRAKAQRVMPVPARDHANKIVFSDLQLSNRVLKRVADDTPRLRKTRSVGKARTVVHHRDVKLQIGGIAAKRLGHVPAAEEDEPLRRQKRARITVFLTPASFSVCKINSAGAPPCMARLTICMLSLLPPS